MSASARAQANRLARGRASAGPGLGIPVIEVDGSRDAAAVTDLVAEHFAPHLP